MVDLLVLLAALATPPSARFTAACTEFVLEPEAGLYCLDDGEVYAPGDFAFETLVEADGSTNLYAITADRWPR